MERLRIWLCVVVMLLLICLLRMDMHSLNEESCDMGILASHLKDCVIIPELKRIGLHSDSAVVLLMGTAAHESLGGHYLKQPNGPALGIYQQEKATLVDLWENWLRFHPELRDRLKLTYPDPDRLQWDLRYATLWARLDYYREKESLPAADDLKGLAQYWYRYWCQGCRGTVAQWLADYQRYTRYHE